MKFLCLDCDAQMDFVDRHQPGDGTFAAAFTCPRCGRSVAMLANPMETQMVSALGVQIGGRELDEQPMEFVRKNLLGRDDAFVEAEGANPPTAQRRPQWSAEAEQRLARVPGFVRGMVKRLYGEFALERGIAEITPAVMDRARTELGLEEM